MSGTFNDLLSNEGQTKVKKIDHIIIAQNPERKHIEIFNFDIRDIDPLPIEPIFDDDAELLIEDRAPREIGIFIQHEDF